MIWVILLIVLVLAFFLFSFYAYSVAFFVPSGHTEDIYQLPEGEQYERERERMTALIREMEAIPFEEVSILSHDGLRLFARYYHVKDGAPVQIQCHGWRGTAIRDFCGGNKLAREYGHNTLVIDQRAHGKSEGHTITFGIEERFDCLGWIHYLNKRFGSHTPIILSGVSMGAATVLMTTELDLPKNVVAVIADSPYSSPDAILRKVSRDKGFPSGIVTPVIWFGGRIFGHFDFHMASPVLSVQNTKIPILIIHGEDDRFVPCGMSKEIADACASSCVRETFPGAVHGISFITDPDRYAGVVEDFICRLPIKI